MELIQVIEIVLQVIGGATVLLNFIAPLTKTKKDDKILKMIEKLLSILSLNRENGTLTILVKRK